MNKKQLILTILFVLSIALNILFIFKNTLFQITQTKPKEIIAPPLNDFNYSYLINTNNNYCGKDDGKDLLFIAFVPVSPKSFEKRDLIRSTWASDKYLKSKAKVIFLLGRSNESVVNLQIKNESLKYADIVQNDFMDSYYNLTIKTIMGFKWVSSNCQNAKYILKIDDDVVVNVPFLIDYLEGLVENNTIQNNTLICKCYKKSKVYRNKASKFYLSETEYKNNYFHQFCAGPAYLMTNDLVSKMYSQSLNTKLIKLEDVYVGLLAEGLNTTFFCMDKNYRTSEWQNKIANLKVDKQLKEKYFIYSRHLENFKEIWNYLVENAFK